MGITDIGATSAQESQQNSDNDDYESDYERFDLDGSVFGAQHPASAVRGDLIALRKLWDDDDPDRADVAAMLTDPSIVTSDENLADTRVVIGGEDESDDFKVVNLADDQTAALGAGGKIDDVEDIEDESDLMGVDFAGNTFYGDVQTEFDFDAENHALKRGGGAGRSITATLDVNGATSARTVEDEDGNPVLHDGGFPQHNGGLIEYHPEGRDGERPRYARDPELRPDVEGQDVVIMIQRLAEIDPDYDGPAYWSTVFADLSDVDPVGDDADNRQEELAAQYAEESDDKSAEDFVTELDGETFVKLQPTDEFEPDSDLLRDTGYILWQRPDPEEINEQRVEEGFDEYDFNSSGDDDE